MILVRTNIGGAFSGTGLKAQQVAKGRLDFRVRRSECPKAYPNRPSNRPSMNFTTPQRAERGRG